MNKVATMFPAISEAFSRWIDSVAEFTASALGHFSSPRTVRLVEQKNDEFVLQVSKETRDADLTHRRIRIAEGQIDYNESAALAAVLTGSHIELVLQSDRFLFRPLELPNRAAEFMNGIVRSQIDRLTPWNADNAAFGWSKPVETDAQRMLVTIAATALTLVRPYVKAIADIGAHSIAVFTALPDGGPDATPIKVWEQKGRGIKDIGRIRQALVMVLAAASITTGLSIGANAIVGPILTTQQDELARQISNLRTMAGGAGNTALGSITMAQRALERRKHDTPSTVLALETLSKILPDQTYVTEFRVEGNKLRLTGISRNAPSLIELIEQSGRFTRATFFAPTTRSTSDTGDRFHIEAVIKPLGPSS
jgi:general secretion pathway protein L